MSMSEFNKQLGEEREAYNTNVTIANIVAIVASHYVQKAEAILVRKTQFTQENKQNYKHVERYLSKILKKAETLPENDKADALFDASNLVVSIIDILSTKHLTKEDEVKLISHIQNNYK